jgi:hypothetical protein
MPAAGDLLCCIRRRQRPHAAPESGAEAGRRKRAVLARALRQRDGFVDLIAEQPFGVSL